MSATIEQQQTGIPTGAWNADTVHSSVAFEVPYAVATFGGEVTDFEATLEDGKLSGADGSLFWHAQRREGFSESADLGQVFWWQADPEGRPQDAGDGPLILDFLP